MVEIGVRVQNAPLLRYARSHLEILVTLADLAMEELLEGVSRLRRVLIEEVVAGRDRLKTQIGVF